MQPLTSTAIKNKTGWWSHVKTMAPTAPQSKALVIQPEGRRPRREDHEIVGRIMYRDITRRWES